MCLFIHTYLQNQYTFDYISHVALRTLFTLINARFLCENNEQ